MRLKRDVLTEFKATWYPQVIDHATLFDRAHREIVTELPVRSGATDVSLLSGIDSYPLPDNVFRVEEAYYVSSADLAAWSRLKPYDFTYEPDDGYDWTYPNAPASPSMGWRVVPNASTLGGGLSFQIGPPPSLGSDEDGYPFVRLVGASWSPLEMDDELPRGILSEDLYLAHMAMQWARKRDPERFAYWKAQFDELKGENMRHLKNRMPKTAALKLVPATARTQTRRR